MGQITRRRFLKDSLFTTAGAYVGLASHGSLCAAGSSSDRVRLAILGMGGRGGQHHLRTRIKVLNRLEPHAAKSECRHLLPGLSVFSVDHDYPWFVVSPKYTARSTSGSSGAQGTRVPCRKRGGPPCCPCCIPFRAILSLRPTHSSAGRRWRS